MTLQLLHMLWEAKRRCDLFPDLYPEPVDITRVRMIESKLPFHGPWKEMVGLALGTRTIIIKPGHASQPLVTHELVHVWQAQALGNLRQFVQYEIETRRKGYFDNRFEVEARFVAGQE